MSRNDKRNVVYVTQGWGPHDARWVKCLADLHYRVEVFSLGADSKALWPVRNCPSADELRSAVLSVTQPETPIVAGPLNTVTRHLVDLPRKVIGLSWGYDLQLPAIELEAAEIRSWLPRLHGLVVDCLANHDQAVLMRLRPKQVQVIPWGIDLSEWMPLSPRNGRSISSTGRKFLSLRRHEPTYRISDIVNAFALVQAVDPSSQLIIGNLGSETESLKELAETKGVHHCVRFIGWVQESHLRDVFQDADLYVSASEFDGSSVTLLQAMAIGVPVAVTDIPGNLEWISDGFNGQVFPLGRADRLSKKMLSDHSALEAQAQEAQRTVLERADWEANQRRIVRLLH